MQAFTCVPAGTPLRCRLLISLVREDLRPKGQTETLPLVPTPPPGRGPSLTLCRRVLG